MKKLICFLSIYFVIFIMLIIFINNKFLNNLAEDYAVVYYTIGFTFIFWYITILIYLLQIILVIFGLVFHFIKEKQTIRNLLIPYGFIFTLKNYYKELKWNYIKGENTTILNRVLTENKGGLTLKKKTTWKLSYLPKIISFNKGKILK